ncbi:MAG: HEAT repeat domain-containing protein [Ardenticatenales bacterium]|nr:HEAT repeat domain-containing protein [Ardenticatenales bacterium]
MEREKLAQLLDRMANGDTEAHQTLLDYIMQQPEGIRLLAYEALRDGGDDTYEQLMLTLADDPNLVVRAATGRQQETETERLGELHPIAQQAEREWQAQAGGHQPPQLLLDTLRTGERAARVQAARALSQYADPSTVTALVAALRGGERHVAAAAVESLQLLGEIAVPALVALLRDPDEQIRWSATKVLSTTANGHAVPGLVQTLEDQNYGVRWLAAEGLAHAGKATLVPLLRRLTEEKTSAWLRQGAWHALNKLNVHGDEERRHYKQLADTLKRSSSAAIPPLVRAELRRLGEEA